MIFCEKCNQQTRIIDGGCGLCGEGSAVKAVVDPPMSQAARPNNVVVMVEWLKDKKVMVTPKIHIISKEE